jgi:hypothetical protein
MAQDGPLVAILARLGDVLGRLGAILDWDPKKYEKMRQSTAPFLGFLEGSQCAPSLKKVWFLHRKITFLPAWRGSKHGTKKNPNPDIPKSFQDSPKTCGLGGRADNEETKRTQTGKLDLELSWAVLGLF